MPASDLPAFYFLTWQGASGKPKLVGSRGSMVAKLKLKGISVLATATKGTPQPTNRVAETRSALRNDRSRWEWASHKVISVTNGPHGVCHKPQVLAWQCFWISDPFDNDFKIYSYLKLYTYIACLYSKKKILKNQLLKPSSAFMLIRILAMLIQILAANPT